MSKKFRPHNQKRIDKNSSKGCTTTSTKKVLKGKPNVIILESYDGDKKVKSLYRDPLQYKNSQLTSSVGKKAGLTHNCYSDLLEYIQEINKQ